jgi:hypothetical protein
LRSVPEELYQVAKDPRELRDRLGAAPPELLALRNAHRQWQKELLEGVRPRTVAAAAPTPVSTPAPPSAAPPARTHLLIAGDGQPRLIHGNISAAGRIVRYRMMEAGTDHGIWLSRQGALQFSIPVEKAGGRLYFETEPPDAALQLDVRVGDRPLAAGELLAGPYGLPLFDPPFRFGAGDFVVLQGSGDSPPPHRGDAFAVFLWREGNGAASSEPRGEEASTVDSEKLDAEVEQALRGWGYIQKGEKALK